MQTLTQTKGHEFQSLRLYEDPWTAAVLLPRSCHSDASRSAVIGLSLGWLNANTAIPKVQAIGLKLCNKSCLCSTSCAAKPLNVPQTLASSKSKCARSYCPLLTR